MSDDIVTRLRALANSVIDKTDERFQWLTQAADEIERLRYELTQANNQIKLLIAIETA